MGPGFHRFDKGCKNLKFTQRTSTKTAIGDGGVGGALHQADDILLALFCGHGLNWRVITKR